MAVIATDLHCALELHRVLLQMWSEGAHVGVCCCHACGQPLSFALAELTVEATQTEIRESGFHYDCPIQSSLGARTLKKQALWPVIAVATPLAAVAVAADR